ARTNEDFRQPSNNTPTRPRNSLLSMDADQLQKLLNNITQLFERATIDIINGSRNDVAEVKPGHSSGVSHAANETQNRILKVRNDRQGKTRENDIATKPIKEEPKRTCAEIRTASDEDTRVPSEREQVEAPEGNERNAKIAEAGSESRGDEKSGTEDDNPAETKEEVRFDSRDDKDKIVMVPVDAITTEKCEEPSRKESDPRKARSDCRNDNIILAEREIHEVKSDHLSSRDSPTDSAESDNDRDGRHTIEIATDYCDQEGGDDTAKRVKPINPEPDPRRTPSAHREIGVLRNGRIWKWWQRKGDDEITMMHLIKSMPMNTWINAPAAKQWSCTTMSHRKAVGRRKRLTEHIKFHLEYFEERHRIMMTARRRKKVTKNEPDLRNIQPAIKEKC
ncbi:8883_t:CDS:2, partial [Acaulospora morrowiae]